MRIPELAAFVQSLREVVAARDRDRLMAMISPQIRYSFGINEGKAGFIKQWGLEENPANSPLWPNLEEILSLGGALQDDRLYFAPNFFVRFPDGYDQFEYLAVIGEGIAVRRAPEPGAEVLDWLSYTVVKSRGGAPTGTEVEVEGRRYAWVGVLLPDGREGFILDRYVRHPLEARLGIGRTDQGTWEIQALVSGD